MNEAPKCDYCAIMGETPHCHNCKVFNKVKSTPRAPRELPYKLKDLISYIENPDDNFDDNLQVGDYFWIPLYTGEKIKAVLLDKNKDVTEEKQTLRTTFGVEASCTKTPMNTKGVIDYVASEVNRVYLPHMFKLLPKALRESIKPALKKWRENGENKATAFPLWLFSEDEFTQSYYTGDGNEMYEYFSSIENRRAWALNCTWLRSSFRSSHVYSNLNYTNLVNYTPAQSYNGVSFGFCI